MRMRSTGLGTTELIGKVDNLTCVGDHLVLHVRTVEPVRWHVRAALNLGEMLKVLVLVLKPANLLFVLTHVFKPTSKTGSPPPEF